MVRVIPMRAIIRMIKGKVRVSILLKVVTYIRVNFLMVKNMDAVFLLMLAVTCM